MIKRGPGWRGVSEKSQIVLCVIANGIKVIGPGAQPAIASSIIVFYPRTFI